MRNAAYLIPVISLCFIVFIGNYQFLLHDESFYTGLLEKHGSYDRVEGAGKIHSLFLEYISDDSVLFGKDVGYTDREISHLRDVKVLMQGFNWAWWIALVLLFASLLVLIIMSSSLFSMLQRFFLLSGVSILGSGLVLIVGSLLFIPLFHVFHVLFFSSGTWVFSSQDLLIRMYPWQFFRDYFVRIIIDSVLVGLVCVFLGWLLGFRRQHHPM
jgi:integral membrane protein (TIGR01906 family)